MNPDAFDDGDLTKEAFADIVLEILWKSKEACRKEETAMKFELLNLPNRVLKQRAKDEGVAQDKIGTNACFLPCAASRRETSSILCGRHDLTGILALNDDINTCL